MLSKRKLTDYFLYQEGASIPDKDKLSRLREKTQGRMGTKQHLPDKGNLSKLREKAQGCTSTIQHLPDKTKLSKFRDECSGSTDLLPDKSKLSKWRSCSSSEHSGQEDMPRSAEDLDSSPAPQTIYYIYGSVGNVSQQVSGSQNSNFKLEGEIG